MVDTELTYRKNILNGYGISDQASDFLHGVYSLIYNHILLINMLRPKEP
jgi:hypothetical protein